MMKSTQLRIPVCPHYHTLHSLQSPTIETPTITTDNDILELVRNTDRGTSISKQDRLIFRKWFNDTSMKYQTLNQSPIDNDLAYGNFDVTYVDGGKSQSANPASGRLFRGMIGRFLYRNEGLFQHLIKEQNVDGTTKIIAINYVKGKLFNFIHLAVILKGVLTRMKDEDRLKYVNKYNNPLSIYGTARVDFEPPIIAFGRPEGTLFSMRVGPGSYVILDTPYLSPTIRLGLGSKGSQFLFSRTNDPLADTWKQYLAVKPSITSKLGKKILSVGMITFFVSANVLQQFASPLISMIRKACKVVGSLMFVVGLFLYVSRGGIERDELALDVSKGL